MIRKTIIVVLTLGALGTGVMFAMSFIPKSYRRTHVQQVMALPAWEVEVRTSRGRVYAATMSGWLFLYELRYCPPPAARASSHCDWWVIQFQSIHGSGKPQNAGLDELKDMIWKTLNE